MGLEHRGASAGQAKLDRGEREVVGKAVRRTVFGEELVGGIVDARVQEHVVVLEHGADDGVVLVDQHGRELRVRGEALEAFGTALEEIHAPHELLERGGDAAGGGGQQQGCEDQEEASSSVRVSHRAPSTHDGVSFSPRP